MSSVLDLLKRLFSRRKSAARAPAMSFGGPEPLAEAPIADRRPVVEPPPPPPLVAPPPTSLPGGEAEEADEEEEPDDLTAEDESDPDDLLAPDPFVSPDAPLIEALSPGAIGRQRAEALVRALTGAHRVFLAEPAGPGTLAEALNILAREGKVAAEFHDDAEEGPYLLYRVVDEAIAPPPARPS